MQQHGILHQKQAISPIPSTSSAAAQPQDQQSPEGQVLQYLYFRTSKASKLSTSPPQRASTIGLEQGEDETLVSLTSRDKTSAHAHSPARKTHAARDSAAGNGASDVRGVAAADACDTGAEGQVTAFLSEKERSLSVCSIYVLKIKHKCNNLSVSRSHLRLQCRHF